MMKKCLLFIVVLSFAGCGTINSLNSNMQEMNGTLEQNIDTMKFSVEKIQENTAEVTRSTNQMESFKKIISSNTDTINEGVDGAKEHTSLFPILFVALIALLFLPTVICIVFYHKFFQKIRPNLRK